MPPLIVRTLRHEFRLNAETPALREALRFMEIAPELPDFALTAVDIDVAETQGFCRAILPDGQLVEGSPSHLMHVLHGLIFNDVAASEPDAAFLHGATVVIGGKRVLLLGHKGSGKTTLTLHLLAHGHTVEGDEHLLVRPADVVARPRTLRVKPGTLAMLPELASAAGAAASIDNWDGTPIVALPSKAADGRWIIRTGPLDAIVFLTSNHGGRSTLDALPPEQALRRLMAEIVRWPTNVLAAATRLRALVSTARTGEMLLGDLAGAEWHLRKLVGS